MHCLLHLHESLNLEGFLSLSHLENASLGPLWSFNYQDRNDRFPTLSYSSNNEIHIFLRPLKGTPRCSAQRNNLVQQETRERMVDILLSFILQKKKCKIYVNYIPYFLKKNSRPSINRLPRIISSPPPLLSSSLFLLCPPCQVLLESDPVLKLISEDSSHGN